MPRHINSAYRAYVILAHASTYDPNATSRAAWMTTFGVDEPTEREDFYLIVEKLRLLEGELSAARQQMLQTDYSNELFEPAFAAALKAVDPQIIDKQWSLGRQYLSSTTLNALRFCSELLPDEETPLEEEELKSVWDRLGTLRDSLEEGSLPDEIRAFVEEQVTIIEHALSEYEILGAKAFRRAIVEGSLSYSEHENAVIEHRETPAIQEVAGIWQQVVTVTERASTVQKLLASGVKIARLIGGIADQVNRVM